MSYKRTGRGVESFIDMVNEFVTFVVIIFVAVVMAGMFSMAVYTLLMGPAKAGM